MDNFKLILKIVRNFCKKILVIIHFVTNNFCKDFNAFYESYERILGKLGEELVEIISILRIFAEILKELGADFFKIMEKFEIWKILRKFSVTSEKTF